MPLFYDVCASGIVYQRAADLSCTALLVECWLFRGQLRLRAFHRPPQSVVVCTGSSGGVFVLPDHRNKGVASALCKAIKEEARVMGISSLYLFTPDQQGLYERLGWRAIEAAQWRGLCGSLMVADIVG